MADVVEHVLLQHLRAEALEGKRLPVLRQDPVVRGVQSVGRGGHHGLVPVDGGEGADLALTLEIP